MKGVRVRPRATSQKTWKEVVDNDLKCLHLRRLMHYCKKWTKLIRHKQSHSDMCWLSTSVFLLSVIVHGHILKTKQDRPMVTIELHTEYCYSIPTISQTSPEVKWQKRSSCNMASCLTWRHATSQQLWTELDYRLTAVQCSCEIDVVLNC